MTPPATPGPTTTKGGSATSRDPSMKVLEEGTMKGGTPLVTAGIPHSTAGSSTTSPLTGTTSGTHTNEHVINGKAACPTCTTINNSSGALLAAPGPPGTLSPANVSGRGDLTTVGLPMSVPTLSFSTTCMMEEVSKSTDDLPWYGSSVPGVMKP